jgi:hypothetical protein
MKQEIIQQLHKNFDDYVQKTKDGLNFGAHAICRLFSAMINGKILKKL